MIERHPIKYFAPSWFAMIMGTGGLANVLYNWQNSFSIGHALGTGIAILADLLYFVVLIPWILRWLRYFPYVQRDLHHPVITNFFVTMPVATAIVGTNIYLIWNQNLSPSLTYALVFSIWVFAILGVSFFTFYTTFQMMRVEVAPEPELVNFSWIMAPIANMAVLLIGNPVLSMTLKLHPKWALSVLLINTILFGIGFFLFLFISAIIFVRLAQHSLPPAETTPTFGIFLSAVGLAISAIIDTGKNAHSMGLLASTDLSNLGAAVIWGFGFWIVGLILLVSFFHFRRGGIPFSLGWWAFIFPLAAYTLASQKVAAIFPSCLAFGYTLLLTLVLILLWTYTFSNTVKATLQGKPFIGIALEEPSPASSRQADLN